MRSFLNFALVAGLLSGISGLSVPRAESVTCKLQLLQNSAPLGYMSSKLNEFGEYGILTGLATEALEVTFTPENSSTQMDLRVTGASVEMPMLGGIVGFYNENDDLASGSYHHAYIGLTSQTSLGATPQEGANSFDRAQNFDRKIESAIWSFNLTTKALTPQWINADTSTPENIILYVDKQNVLVITGDKDELVERFKEEFETQGTITVEVVSEGGKPLGYLSSQRNAYGEYGTLQDTATGALSVTFRPSRSKSNQLDLRVAGERADMAMLGGIIGFTTTNDNLVSGSHNYAYVGLTAQTAPGSVPVKGANSFDKVQNFERKIESAIWTFDSGTKQLTPQWVNTNRGTPKNYLLHMADEKALVFTADKAEFRKVMNVTFSEVTLYCVA
ncbi:hypothetical protein RSOLAG1IB_09051 [Rhizoctonia solani AG-1 IB]|uniref:Uncharacterized protein n=1 Tax=Thanatephorus cucumeris (strain AG1-IB / isolate 7/3/14) TaxID=1108050 RepID=A0A0B7FQ85_THACB|nr:hypothetical protein RSOLAG1IB_09051 [Rhizoctonia solani AG-1 IB]